MNKDELIDYCKEASQTISELDYKNRILEKENQELKKKYENAVEKLSEQLELLTSKLDEYDLIVDERNQLKQQLKEKNIEYFRLSKENNEYVIKLHEYKTQQKEFIKYLKGKIKYFKDLEQFAIKVFNNKAVINLDLVKISIDEDRIVIENLEETLQKYKEIIGGNKDEK